MPKGRGAVIVLREHYKDGSKCCKVSAVWSVSIHTYALRRFLERGRGFSHATVAGLVSRSRFLCSFCYFMGDFELRRDFDSSLSAAPCRDPPPATVRQSLFPYFAHATACATVAGLHSRLAELKCCAPLWQKPANSLFFFPLCHFFLLKIDFAALRQCAPI